MPTNNENVLLCCKNVADLRLLIDVHRKPLFEPKIDRDWYEFQLYDANHSLRRAANFDRVVNQT